MAFAESGWMLLLAAVCTVSACGMDDVHDLRLANIQLVSEREPMPAELAKWHPNSRLLKLSFATAANVRDVTRRAGLHLRAETYFCDDKSRELTKLQVIFDRDGAIRSAPSMGGAQGGGPVWLYVAEKSGPATNIETGKLSIPAYDLAIPSGEVCVQFQGRNMALQGFSSNVVRIKSDQFAAALRSASGN